MLLNLWSYSYLLQKTISLTELPFSFSVYSLENSQASEPKPVVGTSVSSTLPLCPLPAGPTTDL